MVPSAGLMICLGSDGHVGVGAVTITASCPCEDHRPDHGADYGADNIEGAGAETVTQPSAPADELPCDDVVLEGDVAVKELAHSSSPDVEADDDDDAAGPRGRPTFQWSPAGSFPDPGAERLAFGPPGSAPRVAQILEHRRVVVLLI
jgi:hypothetical protein